MIAINEILSKFAGDMRKLFQTDLSSILVYGSYARGDYQENSDIDVMILVKTAEEQICDYRDQVSDCAFEYLMDYGVEISPIIKNERHFNEWAENLPFYRNVKAEGVVVNG